MILVPARSSLALLFALVVSGCPGAPMEPTYENVEALVSSSCTSNSVCHGGTGSGKANLNFELAAADFRTALVDVPACQYDLMPRVDPGNPDNSWLMHKIDASHDAAGYIEFAPDASWVAPTDSACVADRGFGRLMPYSLNTPNPLSVAERDMVREWIRLGAPGPM